MHQIRSHFLFFDRLGILYEARFLKPMWSRFPAREDDDWESVGVFLHGYASERQGANPAYRHVALDVIEELRARGNSVSDPTSVQCAWDVFRRLLNDQNLNHANNPLCPKGIGHERKHKGKTKWIITTSKSVIEFLSSLEDDDLPSNIVVFARAGLEMDRVKIVHDEIQEISGIGPKIASLFLRDVATYYNLEPTEDRHLLQPVDVWVLRVCEHLLERQIKGKQDLLNIQEWLLKEALGLSIRPERVNEGMWYYASQVALSEYRLSKALDDLEYSEQLLNQHIGAVRQEVNAWDRLLKERKLI